MNTGPGESFMRRAIELALAGVRDGHGGPFGAVIVHEGRIVGEGSNRVTTSHDPTAHAEVVAIRDACARLGRFELAGCEIYASCEPCPMCLTAILWARLDHLYYACTRTDAADAGFDDAVFYDEVAKPAAERAIASDTLLRTEAQAVFRAWLDDPDHVPY